MLSSLIRSLNLAGVGRLLILGSLVGIVAGLGAILFNLSCAAAGHFFLDTLAGYQQAVPAGEHEYFHSTGTSLRVWVLPIVALTGGLLSGLLVWWLAPEASGHGTDSAIDAYHNKHGVISARIPLVKIVASALTIGSGGSGGREGPIAQIGAAFGSFLATKFGLSSRERRILLASGMGAGVGSIFHAPLAGALFAAEILYSDAEFESDALIPAAVSTIIGYSVFSLHAGFDPLFETPDFALNSIWELLPYTLLALIVALAAGLFVKVFYGIHDFSERSKVHPAIKAMLGGALTGLLGVGLYFAFGRDEHVLDVLSFGYGTLQDALLGKVGVPLLLILALGKMLTTSISIGSGGSGGVFGPSMVIGGCLGGVVGVLGHEWFPELIVHPGAYVVVGMAGFFTAAGKVPISTLVMASEMTGNYRLLVPALWVSSLAFMLSRHSKLYRSQVDNRLVSNAHRHELNIDVLEGLKVGDICSEDPDLVTISETAPLSEVVRVFTSTRQHYFPVVDKEGLMTGLLSANDVRQVLEERNVGSVVITSDIAVTDVITLRPDTSLEAALRRFVSLDVGALPVIDPEEPRKVLSMLSRRHLIHAYDQAREAWAAQVT